MKEADKGRLSGEKLPRTSSFAPLGYSDRFIPRRTSERTISLEEEERCDVLMASDNMSWKRFKYAAALETVLNVQPKKRICQWSESRILSLADELQRHCAASTNNFYWSPKFNYNLTPNWYKSLDWACIPRSRSIAFVDTVHSLPGFFCAGHKKLIEWTTNNRIVAFVGSEMAFWTPGSPNLMVYSVDYITTLAFDQTGKVMAAGGKYDGRILLELWQTEDSNIRMTAAINMSENSTIRSLAWSFNGEYILCGQKSGTLSIHRAVNLGTPNSGDYQSFKDIHSAGICDIKFSADYRRFSCVDVSGCLSVWSWANKEPLFTLQNPSKSAVFMDWHPWCSTELVIASRSPASIGVVNTVEQRIIGWYKRIDDKCQINAISFNKLSAELTVACQRFDGNNTAETVIIVLASLEHVADVLKKNRMGQICHLLWSPDGKTLSSVDTRGNFTLWDFFGKSEIAVNKLSQNKPNPPKKPGNTGQPGCFSLSTIR
ncbi:protein cortex isoform X2 [Phlebotomus argentipes]|uniref:protein cortex isoform X2 n=1 Tax=Phlebotomus argentipes TaxID=94469 RepID=UPI002892C4C5|nr:protein cortex isoform X2 [Phlebotomus argentipes]